MTPENTDKAIRMLLSQIEDLSVGALEAANLNLDDAKALLDLTRAVRQLTDRLVALEKRVKRTEIHCGYDN